jgi:hypothetical protein
MQSKITFVSCGDNLKLDVVIWVVERSALVYADGDFHFTLVVLYRLDFPLREFPAVSFFHIVVVLDGNGVNAHSSQSPLSQSHFEDVDVDARVLPEMFRVDFEGAIAL